MRVLQTISAVCEDLCQNGYALVETPSTLRGAVERAYAVWQTFFGSETKYNFLGVSTGLTGGYLPLREGREPKESFYWSPGSALPASTEQVTFDVVTHLNMMALEILDALRRGWDFDWTHWSSEACLRVMHYPPPREESAPGDMRAISHTDQSRLTLLPTASSPGLEILERGNRWRDVPASADYLVVQVGESLPSGLVSTSRQPSFPPCVHRVRAPALTEAASSRMALAYFV
jgi:hypothetical protein